MRTAEEWYHTEGGPSLHNLISGWECDFDEKEVISFLQQVQLDSVKHGMTIAAKIISENRPADSQWLYTAIREARDNLKSIS